MDINKELLEALDGILASLMLYHGPDCSPVKMYLVSRAAIAKARKAIARAKGGCHVSHE